MAQAGFIAIAAVPFCLCLSVSGLSQSPILFIDTILSIIRPEVMHGHSILAHMPKIVPIFKGALKPARLWFSI